MRQAERIAAGSIGVGLVVLGLKLAAWWVTGSAALSDDRSKIKELFSTAAKAWWNSADDPNIRVLKVTPDEAEFWDTPGSVISYVKMAAAAVTGRRPAIGENRKVAI